MDCVSAAILERRSLRFEVIDLWEGLARRSWWRFNFATTSVVLLNGSWKSEGSRWMDLAKNEEVILVWTSSGFLGRASVLASERSITQAMVCVECIWIGTRETAIIASSGLGFFALSQYAALAGLCPIERR